MDVFLAGIIQGSKIEADIHAQDWRIPIREILARRLPQANVYCHYSVHPNSITYGQRKLVATLNDGIRRAAKSDLLIAWLPSASMGSAIEIYEAYRSGAIVVAVTPMAANWVLRAYTHFMAADCDELDKLMASKKFRNALTRKTGAKNQRTPSTRKTASKKRLAGRKAGK